MNNQRTKHHICKPHKPTPNQSLQKSCFCRRTNNMIMANKTFKILTIDGGGIKGLYSSKILEHFEENFNCQMSDYFDMICGTSTGGILALGLSLKLKASDISNLYEKKGLSIFPRQNPKIAFFKQLLGGGKYDDKNEQDFYMKGTIDQIAK